MINFRLLSVANVISIGMIMLFLLALLWGAAELTKSS